MANPFSAAFDDIHPFPIRWIPNQVTGKYDPASPGTWLASGAQTPVVIKGHLSTFGSSESRRLESSWENHGVRRDTHMEAGPIEVGDRRFYSNTLIPKGDLIEFWLNDAGTQKTAYRVLSVSVSQRLMTKYLGADTRYEHHVREVPL